MVYDKNADRIDLEELVKTAKLGVSNYNLGGKPYIVGYALDDYIKDDDSRKRDLQPWMNSLNIESGGYKKIPDWAKRVMQDYFKNYEDYLKKARISDLIKFADKVGVKTEDTSNILKPGEIYKNIEAAFIPVAKKMADYDIDKKELKLTEEEEKIKDKYESMMLIRGLAENAIIYGYDVKFQNSKLKEVNDKYAPKSTGS